MCDSAASMPTSETESATTDNHNGEEDKSLCCGPLWWVWHITPQISYVKGFSSSSSQLTQKFPFRGKMVTKVASSETQHKSVGNQVTKKIPLPSLHFRDLQCSHFYFKNVLSSISTSQKITKSKCRLVLCCGAAWQLCSSSHRAWSILVTYLNHSDPCCFHPYVSFPDGTSNSTLFHVDLKSSRLLLIGSDPLVFAFDRIPWFQQMILLHVA